MASCTNDRDDNPDDDPDIGPGFCDLGIGRHKSDTDCQVRLTPPTVAPDSGDTATSGLSVAVSEALLTDVIASHANDESVLLRPANGALPLSSMAVEQAQTPPSERTNTACDPAEPQAEPASGPVGPHEPTSCSGPARPQETTSGPAGPPDATSGRLLRSSGTTGPQEPASDPAGRQPPASGPVGPQELTSGPTGPQEPTSGSTGPREPTSGSAGPRTEVPGPHVSDTPHHIKWVQFHGARSPVVTQNVNGPCPLLALMNVMLLKGKVQLPSALETVTAGQLMDYVGDAMLDSAPAQSQQPDFQRNMQDAVAILPNLQTGLDVNVKFSGVQEFEYTPECCIFDLLHVRLYHGWVVGPAESEAERGLAQYGYNQLVDTIIANKCSNDPGLSHQALLAEVFLESTASQLTEHGLSQLRQTMCDGELAVFFRNNHFSTIYRYQDRLYLLVTDQGFLREPRVVWETLSSTDGAGQFVDGDFKPLSPERRPAPGPHQVDHDYLVALSLQEESSRQQAQDIQWQEYKQAELGTNADGISDAELARRLQEEEERAARQQQQSAPRQQRLSSTSRSDGRRKNCAVM